MNDKNFVIITDSCADIPAPLVKEWGLDIIPLHFTIGGKTYANLPDHSEMSIKTFYDRVRKGEQSTTSQINPEEFTAYFEPYLADGKDILYIAFSSGLSGTYQNSRIAVTELAEKYPDRIIESFDSLCASFGQGLFVYYAVKLKEEGKSMEEILNWLSENRLNLCHWFTVDDLGHLKRGGRVSAATALVGTMLSIKPVLHVDDEGHLINMSKVRGRKQSLDAIVNKVAETGIDVKNQVIFISHGDCEDEAKYVAKLVKEKCGVKDVVLTHIGPVIGAHSGPGTMAIFFLGTKR